MSTSRTEPATTDGDRAEDVVAGLATGGLVRGGEVVDVEDRDRDLAALAAGAGQLELEHPRDRPEVRESGERVGVGEALEPLAALGGGRREPRPIHDQGRDVGHEPERRGIGRVGVRVRGEGQGDRPEAPPRSRPAPRSAGRAMVEPDRGLGPVAAGGRQRMARIGDGRDGRRLGRLVEPDRQRQLRVRPVRVLEADHRALRAERRDGGGEERPEALVEVGAVDGGRDPVGERVERAGAFDRIWHRRSPGRRDGTREAGSRTAGRSYTASRGLRHARTVLRARRAAASAAPCRDHRREPPRYARRVKLVVAIVHHEDAGALVDALLDRDYRATRLASSGGFLKQSNATVILGVDDDQVDAVIEVIRETCNARTQVVNPMPPIMEPGEFFMPYPLEVEVGGATVFVLPVDRFERI